MITSKFRFLLEEYQRRKWFPDLYPDPFGEFVDSVSSQTIDDLIEAWKREKRRAYLDVAHYLTRLLPEIQLPEICTEYKTALLQQISENITPDSAFYWVRSSSEEQARELWRKLEHWSGRWEPALLEWAKATLKIESQHAELHKTYREELHLPTAEEAQLRSSRDLFTWQLQSRTKAGNYKELLRFFQMEHWNNAVDWKDLPALAKSVAATCQVPHSPVLQSSPNSATQFLYPVSPPGRAILEYGKASGPYDAMRFLVELGKGFFYKGINPAHAAEERICGDPSLPWFWGYLYGSLLIDPEGVKSFIGLNAESMTQDTQLVLQFWYRHELMLTIFRRRVSNFNDVQDLYSSLWDVAFPVAPPDFLSLYELALSPESDFRWIGLLRSQSLIKHLRSKYGRRWFADSKWARRTRDYWWEGYRMTTSGILSDQQIAETVEDPFL